MQYLGEHDHIGIHANKFMYTSEFHDWIYNPQFNVEQFEETCIFTIVADFVQYARLGGSEGSMHAQNEQYEPSLTTSGSLEVDITRGAEWSEGECR